MKAFSPSCQYSRLHAIVTLLVVGTGGVFAGPFQNLDFESAVIQAAPPNYVPWDAYQPIDAAAALPFWTAREDNFISTALWGDAVSLDETSVALVTPSSQIDRPIQGSYSIQLSAWADIGAPYFRTASISQVGDVPIGTRSIQFLLRSPPQAGSVQANPAVSFNDVAISVFPQSKNGDVITMVGDVSAFAGLTAELKILCDGAFGSDFLHENHFDLDAISFSPNPVPEPTICEVLLLAAGVWLFRKVSSCRRPTC
jgi:hypothetical protein